MDSFDIAASAMTAHRLRLDTISSNLANANTTRQADGSRGAYLRKNIVFAPILDESQQNTPGQGVQVGPNGRPLLQGSVQYNQNPDARVGVQVLEIQDDTETPTRKVYEPGHPDADEKGFVEYPNINMITEMVDMIAASRAYEASVTAFQSTKAMNESTLQM